jgi:tetratricopeptide (TPR) repeat protein
VATPNKRPLLTPSWPRQRNLALAVFATLILVGTGFKLCRDYLAYYYYSQALTKADNLDQLATLTTKATTLAPGLPHLKRLAALANLQLMKRDLETNPTEPVQSDYFYQAVEYAEQALELEPKNSLNYLTLASLHQEISPYLDPSSRTLSDQQIPGLLAQAILLQPLNAQLYLHLGEYYQSQDGYAEALSLYQKALTLQPQTVSIIWQLATLYEVQGDFTTTREYLIEIMNLLDINDPNYWQNYNVVTEKIQNLPKE